MAINTAQQAIEETFRGEPHSVSTFPALSFYAGLTTVKVLPGVPYPLGAYYFGNGTNGTTGNCSWNHRCEGDTADAGVLLLRSKQQRNFLTLLVLSQGVMMLLGGDELGRTQQGNNDSYCQDNEISWYDWNNINVELLEFTRRLIALRRAQPVFRRPRWFEGIPMHGSKTEEILWFTPEGKLMTEEHWGEGKDTVLAIFLNGDTDFYIDPFADPVCGSSFFLVINAHHEKVTVTLPDMYEKKWTKEFDTCKGWCEAEENFPAGNKLEVESRSCWLLRN